MVQRFRLKLDNVAPDLELDVYVDKTMAAGAEWSAEIDQELARTTHFVAFLCDEYWASEQCKRELHAVLGRYKAAKASASAPRLLFVRAGEMNLKYFSFDQARKRGELSIEDKRIGRLADLNFLGPYDLKNQGQLETLERDNSGILDKQLAQLLDRLIATLK